MTTADDGVTWMTGTRQPTPEEAEIARLQSELSALRTRAETAERERDVLRTGIQDWEVWGPARAIYEAENGKHRRPFNDLPGHHANHYFHMAKAALLAFLAARTQGEG